MSPFLFVSVQLRKANVRCCRSTIPALPKYWAPLSYPSLLQSFLNLLMLSFPERKSPQTGVFFFSATSLTLGDRPV